MTIKRDGVLYQLDGHVWVFDGNILRGFMSQSGFELIPGDLVVVVASLDGVFQVIATGRMGYVSQKQLLFHAAALA